ncbi:MAG: hypothetical protein ACT4O1_05390 [Gemmatimonadota bacterium]
MLYQESWALDCEAFDGDWMLTDCADQVRDEIIVLCVARMLVVRIVADAVRRQLRSEDLREDVAVARAYLAELELEAFDGRALDRLLAALTPFDPQRITDELLALCAAACTGGLNGSARCVAELAYETALFYGLDDAANGSALALARLAALQECPQTSRRWQARSHVHARRAAHKRFAHA